MKFLFKMVFVFFSLYSTKACAVGGNELEHVKYLKTYASYLGVDIAVDPSLTPRGSFEELREIVIRVDKAGGKIPHDRVSAGPRYGNSFTLKNEELIKFVAKALSGQSTWKKKNIEQQSLAIADVGCGLGLSSLMLISELVSIYERDHWKLASPLKIDLLDITPEHQPALQALAGIVNAAYPRYFNFSTRLCDVSEAFATDTYVIMLAINLMHYISEARWPLVFTNFESAMKSGGLLFMTTEPYQIKPISLVSPFYVQASALFSEEGGGNKYGMTIWNPFNVKYLKDNAMFNPGSKYTATELDFVKIEEMLNRCLEFTGERELVIKTTISTSQAIEYLRLGGYALRAGCYCFDSELLERAIKENLSENSKLKILRLKWVEKIKNSPYGSTVGITLMKAK